MNPRMPASAKEWTAVPVPEMGDSWARFQGEDYEFVSKFEVF